MTEKNLYWPGSSYRTGLLPAACLMCRLRSRYTLCEARALYKYVVLITNTVKILKYYKLVRGLMRHAVLYNLKR